MEPRGSSLSAASLASISACEATDSEIGMEKPCKIPRNPSPRRPGWYLLSHPVCSHSLGLFCWRSRARRSAMTWSCWIRPGLWGVLGFCLASKVATRLAGKEIRLLKNAGGRGEGTHSCFLFKSLLGIQRGLQWTIFCRPHSCHPGAQSS